MKTVIGDNLKKQDAKKLRDWWNANTKDYYFIRKMDNSKYWEVYKQTSEKKKTTQ